MCFKTHVRNFQNMVTAQSFEISYGKLSEIDA